MLLAYECRTAGDSVQELFIARPTHPTRPTPLTPISRRRTASRYMKLRFLVASIRRRGNRPRTRKAVGCGTDNGRALARFPPWEPSPWKIDLRRACVFAGALRSPT